MQSKSSFLKILKVRDQRIDTIGIFIRSQKFETHISLEITNGEKFLALEFYIDGTKPSITIPTLDNRGIRDKQRVPYFNSL
jgi:hypothetical protein